MTLYRISNDKVCIGLVSDDGEAYGGDLSNARRDKYRPKYRKIIDAPPYAHWTIGKETYQVIRWFKQRGFTVQSKRLKH